MGREGLGSWGKLGPSGCSVTLPAPEVWLGDSRPTCSAAPYTDAHTNTHAPTVTIRRWSSTHGSRWIREFVQKRLKIYTVGEKKSARTKNGSVDG